MKQFDVNGVTTVLHSLPSASSVTLSIFLKAGLPYEFDQETGISHFLEHMCFRGTKRRSAYQITKEVDALGAQINAYTSKEFTCYFITVLPECLAEGADILFDIVFHSQLLHDNIELEKSIIGEEINMYEDTPDEKIIDVLNEQLFDNAFLGKPILGTSKTIGGFSPDILSAYYKRYFDPKNIKCVVAGAMPEDDQTASLISQFVSAIPFHSDDKNEVMSNSITFSAKSLNVNKDLEQMHLCYGFPGLDYNHSDRYVLTMLTTLMGGSMSSRLFQSVREQKGLAYSIYCTQNCFHSTGAVIIYAGTAIEKRGEAEACIENEFKKLQDTNVQMDEFERTYRQLKGNIIINLEGSSAWANWLGRQLIYNTGMSSLADIQAKLDAITYDDLIRVSKDVFDSNRQVKVALGRMT